MDIAYSDSEQAEDLSDRVEAFVDTVVLPAERDLEPGEPISDERVDSLRERAREHDVYCPQIDEAYGGMGMDFIDALPAFEQAGRSLLGPPAMRVDAPDEGNMHTLELVGTDEQKERWLRPLVAGEMKSAFAMTEPMQGAGSDPKMLKTTAEKDGDEWVIEGHKWWTSQGSEADVFLVMARTDPAAHPYSGCSIILVPAGVDGIEIVRDVPALSDDVYEVGHSEVRFEGVRVSLENTLGPENECFSVAQQRLGPARLTHCMRFSGMAQRSLDVATAYLTERDAFGSRLSEKQTLRQRIADAHIRIHATRTMVRHAAERIAAGHEARIPVAMSKVFAANMVQEVVDLAVQCCGGAGISKDLPLADFYENLRFFRIGDGADEVHRRVIAREAFQEVDTSELDSLPRF
jgi:acyl-CoA dehydrogenase